MRKKDILGLAIIAAILTLAGAALYARSVLIGNRPQLDEETLCPVGRELTAHTVVLVDRTDPLTPDQSTRLLQLLQRVRKGLKEFEALSIFLITGDQVSIAEPVFSLCAPPQGDQANPWYQNPRKIRQEYEKRFGEPLKAKVEELEKGSVARLSPILATIGAVMRRADMSSKVSRRHLIIVSDLLENTEGFSQYNSGGTNFDAFKKTSSYAATQRTRLDGVTLDVYYVQRMRDAQFQGPPHRLFWDRWFQERGADVTWQSWQ